jgi:hypothetical protein
MNITGCVPLPTLIDHQLARLNAHMHAPSTPQTTAQVIARVKIADECLQWFVAHGLPLERTPEGLYVVWQPQTRYVEVTG